MPVLAPQPYMDAANAGSVVTERVQRLTYLTAEVGARVPTRSAVPRAPAPPEVGANRHVERAIYPGTGRQGREVLERDIKD